MNNEFDYLIYKQEYNSNPEVITLDQIPETGFISTYLYDKTLAEYFDKHKSIKGYTLTKPRVYSPVFYVEFDEKPIEAHQLKEKLKAAGIEFNMYSSGGRSIHFHINRYDDGNRDNGIIKSDKLFVQNNINGADTCLYECCRVFRLAGTVHHNTGDKKELIYSNKGLALEIPYVAPSYDTLSIEDTRVEGEPDYNGIFKNSYVLNARAGFINGGRNNQAYVLSTILRDMGFPEVFIECYVKSCNAQSKEPLTEEELNKILRVV